MSNRTKLIAKNIVSNGKIVNIHNKSILFNYEETKPVIVKKIATVVSNEINFIRNVVKPAIVEFSKVAASQIDKTSLSPLTEYSVDVMTIPTFVRLGMDRQIYEPITTAQLPTTPVSIPMPSIVTIRRSYIHSNIGEINEAIKEYNGFFTDEVIKDVWDKYVLNIMKNNVMYDTLGSGSINGIPGLDLFLLSIMLPNIKNEPPEGIRSSIKSFETALEALITFVGQRMKNLVNRYEMYVKADKLIVGTTNHVTIVTKDVYAKFEKNGGVPDIILGYAIMKNNLSAKYDDVINNSKAALDTWNNHVKRIMITHKLGELNRYRMAYALTLTMLFKDYFDNKTKAMFNLDSVNYDEYLEKVVNDFEDNAIVFNIPEMSKYIVTNLLFSFTNASTFFKYMEEATTMVETITPNEAASYATIRIIADYMVTQVHYGKI